MVMGSSSAASGNRRRKDPQLGPRSVRARRYPFGGGAASLALARHAVLWVGAL
jgi:hypothetical protein